MITDKQSQGYKIAEELCLIHKSQGVYKAQEHFDALTGAISLKFWEKSAILETYRQLVRRVA